MTDILLAGKLIDRPITTRVRSSLSSAFDLNFERHRTLTYLITAFVGVVACGTVIAVAAGGSSDQAEATRSPRPMAAASPTSVRIDWANGVAIIENAPLVAAIAGPGGAMTPTSFLMVASEQVRPGSQLERHEMAHIEQARQLGLFYLPAQAAAIVSAVVLTSSLDGYTLHSHNFLEVSANSNAGLAYDWNEEERRPGFRYKV